MPLIPPLPVSKPGRVRVLQALVNYIPEMENKDEICVDEGDILYLTENPGDDKYYKVRCGEKSGKISRHFGDNEECVSTIEYPLQDAAKRGNIHFLQECLENNVSVNILDRSGSTALYWACHSGHTDIVKLLLDTPNICVSSQNKLGDTPLHGASYKNRVECVRLLIEAGADPHIRNKDLKKPIDMTTNSEIAATLRITMNNRAENLDDYADRSSEEEYDNSV